MSERKVVHLTIKNLGVFGSALLNKDTYFDGIPDTTVILIVRLTAEYESSEKEFLNPARSSQ